MSFIRINVVIKIAGMVNLILTPVLYPGRPVQEDRLKKEFVVIRDIGISEHIEMSSRQFMLAGTLMKCANLDYMLEATYTLCEQKARYTKSFLKSCSQTVKLTSINLTIHIIIRNWFENLCF